MFASRESFSVVTIFLIVTVNALENFIESLDDKLGRQYVNAEDFEDAKREMLRNGYGYGSDWIIIPDGNELPRVALLKMKENNNVSRTAENGKFTDVTPVEENVHLTLYTKASSKDGEPINATNLRSLKFDPSKPTKIIIHGWQSSGDSDTVKSIRDGSYEFLFEDFRRFLFDLVAPHTAGYVFCELNPFNFTILQMRDSFSGVEREFSTYTDQIFRTLTDVDRLMFSFEQTKSTAYLKRSDVNVIGVDWSEQAANIFYPYSAAYTKTVGQYVAKTIDVLVETKGARYKDIHIIGHSLGAHTAGVAGSSTRKKVSRITGLDPALPCFQDTAELEDRLDKSDGSFVEVIHTCSGALGMSTPVGHADFYPNGGTPFQPGCCCLNEIIYACSHGRSHKYFAESILSEKAFKGVKCSTWKNFKNDSCDNVVIPMGEYTPTNARGIFYLQTNSQSPYGLGINGITFNA